MTTTPAIPPRTSAAASSPRGSMAWWGAAQIFWLVRLLLDTVVVGLVRSVLTRQFHWRAFGGGLAVAMLGIAAAAVARFELVARLGLEESPSLVLWGGVMLAAAAGGLATALLGRRVGYWECYAWSLVLTAAGYVHLSYGFPRLLGLGPSDTSTYFDMIGPGATPGARYIGDQWSRILVLVALCGFLLAVMAGSLAYLFLQRRGGPRSQLEWLVSRRHLSSQTTGSASITAVVAVVGIGLGVAALIVVTSVMSGYEEDIRDRILGTNAHLVLQKYGIDFVEVEEVTQQAHDVEGVVATSPFGFNEAMLSVNARGMGVLVKGIDPATAAGTTGVAHNICAHVTLEGGCTRLEGGRVANLPELFAGHDLPVILLGAELFKKVGKPVGSVIHLTTPVGIAGARGNAPKRVAFRVGGAFRSGMHEFDVRLAYTDLGAFQRLMGLGDAVNGLEIRVRDPERVELVKAQVLRAVGRYPYHAIDWRELNDSIFTALKMQKVAMFLVLCFIVIVAAFNIASTLFMAVVEKAREIAVLQSMGAGEASIMKIFVFEGWILGGIGTLAGVVLGLLLCLSIAELKLDIAADVYMVESLSVRVHPLEVAITVLAAMGISHLATLYPALRAAAQRPVDAMRYE